MHNIDTYALRFTIGAIGYGFLEIAWCGTTHWTMLLLGGTCFLYLCYLSRTTLPFWAQCACGMLGITGAELLTGLLCNRVLGLCVWDYSGEWCNLYGQICPLYSFFWFVLCVALFYAMRLFARLHAAISEPKRT